MSKRTLQSGTVLGMAMIAFIVIGSIVVGSVIKLSGVEWGFLTGYQGLQTEFNSVKYKGYWYDRTHLGPNSQISYWKTYTASAGEFQDRLNLDPDHPTEYLPNLLASQTPVVIDTDQAPKTWLWRVQVDETTEEGENDTHSWTKTIETYREFQLMRYVCQWDMNLWLSGPAGEAYPDPMRAWRDGELWIKIVPKAFIYFEDNPDRVFFAPSLVQLQDIDWYSFKESKDQEAQDGGISQYQDLIPKAEGETLGLFYARGGDPVQIEESVMAYEGSLLDPEIFRDEYWVKISLIEFKPFSWFELGGLAGWSWKYPSVRMRFMVHVFVVGEWTVKLEKGDIVELEQHEPIEPPPVPIVTDWQKFQEALAEWFENPLNKLALGALIAIGVFVAILIFAPQALFSLVVLYRTAKGGKS